MATETDGEDDGEGDDEGEDTTPATPDEEEKAESMDKYGDVLEAVYALKEMTDTAMWEAFYSRMMKHIDQHTKDMLTASKTREMIQHQEGVKVINALVEEVREPIDDLTALVRSMPLFSRDMKVHAVWDSKLGKVELQERS